MQMAANARGQDLNPHEVLFADLVAHSKKDAAAQEGLVGILCDVLEWYVDCGAAERQARAQRRAPKHAIGSTCRGP